MDVLVWPGVITAAILTLAVVGWRHTDRRDRRRADQPTDHPADRAMDTDPRAPCPQGADRAPTPGEARRSCPGLANTELLIGPPVVRLDLEDRDGSTGDVVTLRDWLVHLHPGDNIWTDVVRDLCAVAADDPAITSFFADGDMDALHRHFLAALMIVTGDGLTVGTYRRLRAQHAGVHSTAGGPITPGVFGTVSALLVNVLRTMKVPEETLRQVECLLTLLREAIVVGPGPVMGSPTSPG